MGRWWWWWWCWEGGSGGGVAGKGVGGETLTTARQEKEEGAETPPHVSSPGCGDSHAGSAVTDPTLSCDLSPEKLAASNHLTDIISPTSRVTYVENKCPR